MLTDADLAEFERLPARVRAVFRCPACRGSLVRAETGWVCPAGLDHTGLVGDGELLDRVRAAIPARPPNNFRRRAWLARWGDPERAAERTLGLMRRLGPGLARRRHAVRPPEDPTRE